MGVALQIWFYGAVLWGALVVLATSILLPTEWREHPLMLWLAIAIVTAVWPVHLACVIHSCLEDD